jgi:hypothetical protein
MSSADLEIHMSGMFTRKPMPPSFKWIAVATVVALTAVIAIVPFAVTIVGAIGPTAAQGTDAATDAAAQDASPIYGVTIPKGYRQWQLIAPAQEQIP